jgi:hypothetical protein
MGIITHLGRRAGRLRRLWRYVRRFVIPLWAVFDPVILRRCERFPRVGGLLKFAAPGRFHRRSPPRTSSAAVLMTASERWWRRTSCEDDALLTRCSSNVELPFLASLAGGRRSFELPLRADSGPPAVAREGQESSQLRRPRPRSAMPVNVDSRRRSNGSNAQIPLKRSWVWRGFGWITGPRGR